MQDRFAKITSASAALIFSAYVILKTHFLQKYLLSNAAIYQ